MEGVVSIDLFWVFFLPFSYNGVYTIIYPFQRYSDIARVESLTPIRHGIRPQIKANYRVIFE